MLLHKYLRSERLDEFSRLIFLFYIYDGLSVKIIG